MKKILGVIVSLFLSTAALAQTLQQSGTVTPGHVVRWTTSGIVQDGGTAANGSLTSLGVTASGPGICQNSAAITGPYQQICLGTTTSGGGVISVQNYGGATAQGLSFKVNGVTQGFPSVGLPVVAGHLASFGSTSGNIVDSGITSVLTADSLLGNPTGISATPTSMALLSCSTGSSALTYNTSTHVFGCNTITGGTGTVTSVATNNGLTGGTITTTGTIGLAAIAADNLLANSTGGSAPPIATAIGSCSSGSSALTYNTSTHAFGCNTISGSGTVNAGTAGQLAYYATSTTAVSGNASLTISGGDLTSGVAGSVVGTHAFANATSGTIKLTPPTGALGSAVLTLPDATDTLIGKATTDTLTNKTYDTAGTGNSFLINGLAATANTGTGAVARAAGPTFTTPTLGVATATTLNGNTFTTGTYTLTGTASKTLNFTNTITLTGTDSSVYTFPTATATIPQTVASGTSALGTGAISSATCATVVTTTATGTATTDTITAGFNSDPTGVTGYTPVTSGALTIFTYPSANNVNFKVCNLTSSSITPGAITLNWRVVR